MRPYRGLWLALALVMIASFAVLGYFGWETYRVAPPVPDRVVSTDGQLVFTGDDIRRGQAVWQSTGGHELGSVWGHGAYVAPDWTADWLHREATWLADHHAGGSFEGLDVEQAAMVQARVQRQIRTNTYDAGVVTVAPERASAILAVGQHYDRLFGDDPALADLRDAYAMPANTLPDPENRRALQAFFWWTSWAASTERPGKDITYTNNWPSEPLVGNVPTGANIVWSVLSFVVLLAGVGGLAWYMAVASKEPAEDTHHIPETDPLLQIRATPSMRATLKYFWVVAALIVVQILLGAVTAHYGVEGSGFYGVPLDTWLPYAVTRSWHTQLGIFWIATAWLATGLFVAPALSGKEPRYQRLGVDVLFVCLVVIVVGTLVGQALGVNQLLSLRTNFWFGHQGFEYVDLGRFWQIFLFVGLFLWLGLMLRALWPAFKSPDIPTRHLLGLFALASGAIALFYGAGLLYGQTTNLAITEYWRWWVVHLWVEGFFEVFATAIIALLFSRMQLVKTANATAAVLLATVIFLSGGIIGTFHHLYFTGTSTAVLALGAVFSALEVVPLVLIGFEAYENLRHSRSATWVQAYRWPIYFFVAVAFWNLVGAGLFGFLINPPIALYFMQGLNTTPVHGHAALFGVYGMLGIGLMLFCLKGLTAHKVWKTSLVGVSFWTLNIGLALMIVLSLLPIGLLQTVASVEHGLWYARSAEFMQQPVMDALRWLRVVGDTVFALGAVALGVFVVGLKTGWTVSERDEPFFEAEPEPA